MIRILVPLVLLLAATAPAFADDEARLLQLPDAGLTVHVPPGWTFEQYGTAALKLESQGAMIWFYASEQEREDTQAPLQRMAERADAAETPDVSAWKVQGARGASRIRFREGDDLRFFGVIDRPGGGFDVEALVPAKADPTLRAAWVGVLASVDARRFANPGRLVDWTLGFTLDGVGDWTHERAKEGGVRIAKPGVMAALRVVSAPTSSTQVVARIDRVLQKSYDRLRALGFEVTPKTAADGTALAPFTLERDGREPLRGVRTTIQVKQPNSEGELSIEAVLEKDLVLLWLGNDDETLALGRERARSFRAATEPGPYAGDEPTDAAPPADRFPAQTGPELRFTLPTGWSVAATTRAMRLATFAPAEGLEGIAYFFGAGRGGSLDANVERWKGQWDGDDPVVTTHEGDGVTTTVLRFSGKHSGMGPHGGAGDTEKVGLLTYVEVEGGPLTLKLVGTPDQMTDAVLSAFDAWVASFRVAK